MSKLGPGSIDRWSRMRLCQWQRVFRCQGPELGSLSRVFPGWTAGANKGESLPWDANPPERNRRIAGKASLIYHGRGRRAADLAAKSHVLGAETEVAHRKIVRAGTLVSRARAGLDGLFEAAELSSCPGCTKRLDMEDDGGVEKNLCSSHEQEPEVMGCHKVRIAQSRSLLDYACIGAVVSRNEAFIQAEPRSHHCYCMSSAGKWMSRGAGQEPAIASSDSQQSRLASANLPRRYKSFIDDLGTRSLDGVDGLVAMIRPQPALKSWAPSVQAVAARTETGDQQGQSSGQSLCIKLRG